VLMEPGEQPPQKMEEMERLFHSPGRTGDADYCPTSEGYFRALGIPLLQGRLFTDGDSMDAPQVAVISQSLAREKWPKGNALGQEIEFGNMDGDLRPLTVVGVVGDIHQNGLEAAPRPTVYANYRQRPQATGDFSVVIRTDGGAAAVISSARAIVASLDPNVPPKFQTLREVYTGSLKARRFNLTLLATFAGAALLLAQAGIYGVVAYSVAQRTREVGIRMALGANRINVVRMIIRQGLVADFAGIAAGVAGALLLTRVLQSFLFGTSVTDPLTFTGGTLLLVLTAVLASYIPARRAAKVDPVVALRYE
ncbi:MAG: FtsX-like permease family protein, partial [Candidatus Angelobacter sp.]